MKTQISVDEQVIMTIFTKYMQAKVVLEKQILIQDNILTRK